MEQNVVNVLKSRMGRISRTELNGVTSYGNITGPLRKGETNGKNNWFVLYYPNGDMRSCHDKLKSVAVLKIIHPNTDRYGDKEYSKEDWDK